MLLSPALRHPLRVLWRLSWLLGELALAGLHYPFRNLLRPSRNPRDSRARWLQIHCRRVLRVVHVELQVEGPIPEQGLVACNHLSYIDVLALGSLRPAIFVAKHEVSSWPVFGWLASLGGTLFVRRDNLRASVRSTELIRQCLAEGHLVVLFPEGTSSGGDTVLPFKSMLLSCAAQGGHVVHAGCIHYPETNGRVADEICYWRDMDLVPHVLNLLGRKGVTARLAFMRMGETSQDRRVLARQLHGEVLRLKQTMATADSESHPAPDEPLVKPEPVAPHGSGAAG